MDLGDYTCRLFHCTVGPMVVENAVYRSFFRGIPSSTEHCCSYYLSFNFWKTRYKCLTFSLPLSLLHVAIDFVNDVLPVWWMEVYSFRFNQSKSLLHAEIKWFFWTVTLLKVGEDYTTNLIQSSTQAKIAWTWSSLTFNRGLLQPSNLHDLVSRWASHNLPYGRRP